MAEPANNPALHPGRDRLASAPVRGPLAKAANVRGSAAKFFKGNQSQVQAAERFRLTPMIIVSNIL
ncbi:hypothetical protein MESS2_50072 [Mesorhizobium metallidurans STM 2683]|uniref:Uncharacterized protein n=1 Tax=Mesorhizobium metallidurans STM 2683 TaxID=1297569 RepID=M5F5Q2_9HYPH|nr:hypothetical protein MESS2_50072 [Mesorhizobium metallidurans STM 2683]